MTGLTENVLTLMAASDVYVREDLKEMASNVKVKVLQYEFNIACSMFGK